MYFRQRFGISDVGSILQYFSKVGQFGSRPCKGRTRYTVLADPKEESKMSLYSPTENAMRQGTK